MKPVKIGLLGLGTVGSGTLNVLSRNYQEIVARAGRDIEVVAAAVKDTKKNRHCHLGTITLTQDPEQIINHPDIDVVLELVGGADLPKPWVIQALHNGKHVVTANKAMIAKHGNEIFHIAQECGKMVAFEAAVAGGIPIIKAIREGLAANHITSLAGIINGTCNYILTEMQQNAVDFQSVLAKAQAKGYAEADPGTDIDGIDVAHKLTILASIAFGIPLQFDQVSIEGIRHIQATDISYANQLGYVIKHLGIAKRTDQGIDCRVHPALIPATHTMAHVNGVMNAIAIQGDALGESLYYGAGAGGEPTASAVIADLVEVVRTLTADPNNRVPHLAVQTAQLSQEPMLDLNDSTSGNYIRLLVSDKPGALADIARIFAEFNISIESIMQKEWEQEAGWVPIVIVTHSVREGNMLQALQHIQQLSNISDNLVRIRLALTGRNLSDDK